MVIMHNMKAMNAGRQMNVVTAVKAKSTEKLSSGYRINRSADDAAGLSISEKMRHQIRGLDRGSANIEEGVGYCQVADGALNEMHDMLQRMNELCIQAANGTLSDSDRGDIDEEVRQLKVELQRICDTTKFNEEYIFRCEDVMPEESHDVYRLSFSGTPKDLFVYNSNDYDTYDDGQKYAGVSYRGRRYSWEEISPNMYDKATNTFREGKYSIRADDNTILTLTCEKGAALPQVSRLFQTSADGRGIWVNNDLVEWSKVKISDNQYSFDYHGMMISYTKDDGDTDADMWLKMTGTVWESTYETPEPSKALDALFSFNTYAFDGSANTDNANDRIKGIVENNKSVKYILHAEDINNGGTIPFGTENIPFDGVWLEATDSNWNRTNTALWKMTWGEFTGLTDADRIKLEQIPGPKPGDYNFGFACDEDNGKHDWSNLTTDVWVGKDITADPNPYPPDMNGIGNDLYGTVGSEHFAGYDKYNTFTFINSADNNEVTSFYFSVINEISKSQAVKALDGIEIGYGPIKVDNGATAHSSGNVTSPNATTSLTLDDEYYLGRDYENGGKTQDLATAQLTYANGSFSLGFPYSRQGGTLTYSGGNIDSIISSKVQTLTDRVATGGTPYTSTSFSFTLNRQGGGTGMTISCNYSLADFGTQNVSYTDDTSGRYIRRKNGTYERYYGYQYQIDEINAGDAKRCNATLTGRGGRTIEDYLRNTVMQDIADKTTVTLKVNDYPKATLAADENPNSAMVTRWQTPFQHPHVIPPEQPPEKPEYLRIQCSSNVTDTIWIQKQKLSVYRLGLTDAGTLTEMHATGSIDLINQAILKVSSVRSLFGAEQNRLEHAYDINRNTHENTQSAESKIRDADMAKEMVKYSNANILEQSGNSMLVQANQANNIVLSLLQ